MKNLKITAGELKILMEDAEEEWGWYVDDYVREHNKKPSASLKKKFIDNYIKEHAMPEDDYHRQVEKENGQISCLLNAFVQKNKHLSINEMSSLLERSGFSRGSSVKTIYRRIIPELKKYSIKKDEDDKYYYDFSEDEIDRRQKLEVLNFLKSLLENQKSSPLYKEAKIFLEKELSNSNKKKLDLWW